ncbi:hypothetical protein D3C80_1746530 [compost metagenome]
MVLINLDVHLRKLLFQATTGHRIAEEQGLRVLIINKETARVRLRLLTPLSHRHAVILLVLHHVNAVFTQLTFFPGASVGRHMHADAEPQLGAHDANRHPQVAG